VSGGTTLKETLYPIIFGASSSSALEETGTIGACRSCTNESLFTSADTTLDSGGAGNTLNLGTRSNAVTISQSGKTTTVNGTLAVPQGNVTLNATSGSTAIGAVGTNAQYTWIDRQVFANTTSGTYTPASGTRRVVVRMCGAGGGGGGATGLSAGGNGGGGGGASGAYIEFTVAASSITGGSEAVGNFSAGGSSSGGDGATGGDTTITINGTTYTAKGGGGGAGQTSTSAYAFASGGQPQFGSSSGDVNYRGQPGGVGFVPGNNIAAMSGAGGSSPFGVGGAAQGLNSAAGTAIGVNGGDCAGGGGAVDVQTNTGVAGGGGGLGRIIVDEYR